MYKISNSDTNLAIALLTEFAATPHSDNVREINKRRMARCLVAKLNKKIQQQCKSQEKSSSSAK